MNRLRTYLLPALPLLALALLAVWPFISRESLPNNTDAELHVFRLAELSRLVRAGILYPRWAPNFYFGYGYPIFNYYAPLSYYIGLGFDLMPVVGTVTAVKAVFVLSLLLAAGGTFVLTDLFWGRRAGYLAAALYLYAPYVQYVDPHARGVLAESLSLGLLPCALAALAYLYAKPSRRTFTAAVLILALTFLAHNLMAMVFGGLLLGWIIWQLALPVGRAAAGWTAVALTLGIGLTLFFWLPVGLEQEAIQLTSVVGEEGSHFSFASHFLSLPELLAPTPLHDWGGITPVFSFNMGVVQWISGTLGALVWLAVQLPRFKQKRPGRTQTHQANFFIATAVILLLLMLPLSRPVWDAIPLLPFLQFPWRLLGPAALALAVTAGSALLPLSQLVSAKAVDLLTVGGVGLTLLQAAPVAQVLPWEPFGETTVAAVTEQEIRGRWLGTTSTGDFVPAAVDVLPSNEQQLLDDLLQNRPPDRINYTSLPEGATISGEQRSPLHMVYDVTSDSPFLLRLFLFDFPGWRVMIDGNPVETEIGRPEGFLVVPVPAGSHQIEVRFASTPVRQWGWLLTAVALLLTVVIARSGRFAPRPQLATPARQGPHDQHLGVLLTVLALAVLLLPSGLLHRHSNGFVKEGADFALQGDFGGQIMLIGADLSDTVVAPGDTITVTVYWKAQQPLEINYQSFVHLLAADGFLKTQSDKLNPGDFPTRRWPLDRYVRDEYKLQIPADTLPGRYVVTAGLWVSAESWRLPVLGENGQQIGDNLPLAAVEVR